MAENMNITGRTKLADLLSAYPLLKERLPQVNEKFKLLNTPLGKIMLKTATVSDMSKRSGIPEQILIQQLNALRLE